MAGNAVNSKNIESPLSITTAVQLVTSVSINPNSDQTKNIGDTFTITPTIAPTNASNKKVDWTSSNPSIATFSTTQTTSGTAVTVTCKNAGTTTITAMAADGSGVSASFILNVRTPVKLTLDKTETTILKGGYLSTVTVTTDPSDFDASDIKWSIADTSIATISINDKTASITSTSKIGSTMLTVRAGSTTKNVIVKVENFTTTTFNYSGKVEQIQLPAGTYKMDCYGAQGRL